MGPDIVIEGGRAGGPYVQQSGGCGVQGQALYLSTTALDANVSVVATSFVNRWMDFRFGVFGYGDDKKTGGQEDNSQHVKLSRQQVLCDGRSHREVIGEHPDLARPRGDNEPMRAVAPTITVIRRPEVQYVLGIETTISMLGGEHWKWVNKAAQKLIRYDLAAGTPVAVLSFAGEARVEHPLLPLKEEGREGVADSIPGKYQLAENSALCMACLVREVVRLEGAERGGVHLILLTRGGADSLTVGDEQTIARYVEEYGIKISTIMIPTVNHLSFYDDASQLSGGESFLIRQSPYPMDTYVNILSSLSAILQADSGSSDRPALVTHRHEVFTGPAATTGTVRVPRGATTEFGIYVEDPEEHLIKSVSFEDEDGAVYGPFTKMSTSYDLINLKMPNLARSSPLATPGQWTYRIEWFPYSGDPIKSTVMVTSTRDVKEPRLEARTWVEPARWGLPDTPHLNIFTHLWMAGRPVLNASLSLSVEVETENGTFLGMSPGGMQDSGLGDVDTTLGDGVYSLALTDYPARGRYRLSVQAGDGGTAHTLVLGTPDQCEEFSRTVRGPVLHLGRLPQGDRVPPSRVQDLRVTLFGDGGHLTGPRGTLAAFWTSPGGDLQQGAVARHVLVFGTSLDSLLGAQAQPRTLLRIDKQTVGGEEMQQLVETPLYDTPCYIAVYAVDEAGNSGRLSNIERVVVVSPPPPSSPAPDPLLGLLQPSAPPDWMMIGVMSSCLGALFLTCVGVLLCFLHTSNRLRRPASPTPSSSPSREDQTDSSSCDSSGRGGSHTREERKELEQQVTELHQIMADQHRIVPVYWSASQLLSKLEQQKSPISTRHTHHHHQPSPNEYENYIESERKASIVSANSPPGYESPPAAVRSEAWRQEPGPRSNSLEEESDEQEDLRPTQFSRNSLYRSTRRGGAEPGYHDTMEVVGGVAEIPEKYFVTVSGFPPDNTNDSFSSSSREVAGTSKPRNITEV